MASDVKVAFLKGTALMTANADGSSPIQLLDDGVAKSQPHWSPGGDKIIYATSGQNTTNPQTLANLVVVTSSGQPINTVPVFATNPNGSGTGYSFSVDTIGWYSENAVFAAGAVNSLSEQYVIFDVKSGQVILAGQTAGEGFEVCARAAQVASGMDTRDFSSNPSVSVLVNGNPVFTLQQTPLPFLHELHWSGDCTRLTFIESTTTNDSLVVFSGTTQEASVPWPSSMQWPLTFNPVGSSFVVRDSTGAALFYDATTHTLISSPSILQQLQQRESAEAQIMTKLAGRSPDWYRATP